MGHLVAKSVSPRFSNYCTDRPRHTSMDTEHDETDRKISAMPFPSVLDRFWRCPSSRYQTPGCRLVMPLAYKERTNTARWKLNRTGNSLNATRRKKYQSGRKQCHSLPCDDGANTVKTGLPKVLQKSDGSDREWPLTTGEFMTEQVNDTYCRETASTGGKPGSV